ncbi:tail fiber assembly protein [Klebsiella quasipneumoniae]|uniref:tail fiber assembly protein n=1 Tax=Klebsiella quasipneumoniae TaxID=1463165 RepID=UPI00352A15FA
MQHVKNFKIALPTEMQIQKFKTISGEIPLFLVSEESQDWYECQSAFLPDTIKIMYDPDGIIVSVIDKPVSQRGNTLAVSLFFPLGMSVVELSPSDYPEGVVADGSWVFDGSNVVRRRYSAQEIQQRAERDRQQLMAAATGIIGIWQTELLLELISEDDRNSLEKWVSYLRSLRLMDFSSLSDEVDYKNINWPEKPS